MLVGPGSCALCPLPGLSCRASVPAVDEGTNAQGVEGDSQVWLQLQLKPTTPCSWSLVYPERTGACGLEVGSCEGEARPQLVGGYYLETLWAGGLPEVGAEKG